MDRSTAGKLYLNGTPKKRITAVIVSNRYITHPDRSSTEGGQDICGELCVVKQASAPDVALFDFSDNQKERG